MKLVNVEDGTPLKWLGPETQEERRFVAEESVSRRTAWRDRDRPARNRGEASNDA